MFVLALDYEVVILGVSKKYGDGLLFQKGKSFFDKMIQVPFRVPMAFYKMDSLLIKTFKKIGIELNDNSKIIDGIIKNSIGSNPRTVKRLLNTFELHRDILGVKQNDPKTNILLLAILSIQLYDDALYSYLLSTTEWADMQSNTIFAFKVTPELSFSDFLTTKLSLTEEQKSVYNFKQTYNLLNLLNNYIHTDSENTIDSDDLGKESDFGIFINLLAQSQVTASGTVGHLHYNTEPLSENLDLANVVIRGFIIDGTHEHTATSFTDTFVKILETAVESSDFIDFVNDRTKTTQAGLPGRMFYRLKEDRNKNDFSLLGYTKSSVKTIHGQDIILHYGRSDLKAYLLKFLKALNINNNIEILFNKPNENNVI